MAELFTCWAEIQRQLTPTEAETKKRTWLQYFWGKCRSTGGDVVSQKVPSAGHVVSARRPLPAHIHILQ